MMNRFLNIGETIGQIAFDYIAKLEKEINELKLKKSDESRRKR